MLAPPFRADTIGVRILRGLLRSKAKTADTRVDRHRDKLKSSNEYTAQYSQLHDLRSIRRQIKIVPRLGLALMRRNVRWKFLALRLGRNETPRPLRTVYFKRRKMFSGIVEIFSCKLSGKKRKPPLPRGYLSIFISRITFERDSIFI